MPPTEQERQNMAHSFEDPWEILDGSLNWCYRCADIAFLTAVNPGTLRGSGRSARRMRSGRDVGLIAGGGNRPLRPQAVSLARARYPLM